MSYPRVGIAVSRSIRNPQEYTYVDSFHSLAVKCDVVEYVRRRIRDKCIVTTLSKTMTERTSIAPDLAGTLGVDSKHPEGIQLA